MQKNIVSRMFMRLLRVTISWRNSWQCSSWSPWREQGNNETSGC